MFVIKPTLPLAALVGWLFASCTAFGDATPDDIAKLGNERTPTGAERAGNADGSIPEWTGGLTEPPDGFVPGGPYIDPYAADVPLFTITAENIDQYRDKLSDGHQAMIAAYPDSYKLPVYPTRRSFANPQQVYDTVRERAGEIQLADGGNGLVNLGASNVPFPFPEDGVEAIWNHQLRYRTNSLRRWYVQAVVQSNGAYSLVKLNDTIAYWTGFEHNNDNQNILSKFLQEITSPARLEGNVLLVHDPIDQVKDARGAWLYNAGQRRVRRAPQVAYDGPGTAAEGARTTDDFGMFNGAPDRYDWTLKGKRELYVPYNAYRTVDSNLTYADIFTVGHINQDVTRYELHRVWEVEANLKEGARHIYAKRIFYIDEDSWAILHTDIYDARGDLWRVHEGPVFQAYDADVTWMAGQIIYDLQANRYIAIGFFNEESKPFEWGYSVRDSEFTPASLRRRGRK